MPKKKRIKQYRLEGSKLKYITTFDSIQEASDSTGIHRNSISSSLTGHHLTGGEYIWKYEDDPVDVIVVPKTRKMVIAQIEPYNGFMAEVYESIRDASRKTGIDASAICKCLNGKTEKAGGWKWIHIEEANYDQRNSFAYRNSACNFNKK